MKRRFPVGVAMSLIVLFLSAAFGGTVWWYERAQSEGQVALALRADRTRDQVAMTVFWHERELINEHLITGAPAVLREIRAQQATFSRLSAPEIASVDRSSLLAEARHANQLMFHEFGRRISVALAPPGAPAIAAMHPYEAAVLAPLQKMVALEASVERARSHSAAAAWRDARLVAILALIAGIGFAIYVYRLLRQVTRQAVDLQQTLGEREQTHLALQDREHQLRQAQKTEAVGRLAGGIAHDFNNMLMAIIGYGALALAEITPAQGRARDALEQIELAARRAAALTAQLLAFSRQQVLQPQVVDINRLVNGLTGMLRPLLGATVELQVDLDPVARAVAADPGQLEQALTNLVVNSRDAMPEGGVITIATTTADPSDVPAELPRGQYVTITVTDTGAGMDAETQSRALDPFFTTKELGKGTGLGLATVHGILTQSGGALRIDSAPGAGTTVSLYLPHTNAAPAAAETESATVASGTETVLLVEDDPVVQSLLHDVLVRAGYEVLVADDGADALVVAAQRDVPPDLMLTDLIMPRMGGRELAHQIQPMCPEMPVIYMSGYTQDATLYDDAEAGRVIFLQKPFTPIEVLQTIRAALAPTTAAETGPTLATSA